MFNFWEISTFGTLLVFGIFFDWRVLGIWLCFAIGYTVLGLMQGHDKANGTRQKIRIGTWNSPSDPNCYGKIEINCEKVGNDH